MAAGKRLHPISNKIVDLLKKHKVWYQTFHHQPVKTSQEAAKLRGGYSLHQGAKALILKVYLKDKKTKFIMLVLAGDAVVDRKKLKRRLGIKSSRFATADEVKEITKGVLPGGIPPFGGLFGLETYLDDSILDNQKIVFNAGDRCFSVGMKLTDYQTISGAVVLTD
ncbi:MAG: hypothetical protein GXP43_02215 [bacterium]|nr:hypothetical protein [bacterium]